MPLYEYRCHRCDKTFEVRQKFAEAPLTVHEGCGGGLERVIFASALQFKGSGFYVNDYGTQMLRFGQSLAARYGERLDLDVSVPEEGYQGEYLLDLADELIAAVGDRYRAALAAAAPDVTALAADTLAAIKAAKSVVTNSQGFVIGQVTPLGPSGGLAAVRLQLDLIIEQK